MKNALLIGRVCLLISCLGSSLSFAADSLDLWSIRNSGTSYDIGDVLYANKRFIAVVGGPGDFGAILTSSNGIEWAALAPPPGYLSFLSLNGIALGFETYVAVGWAGTIYSSTNGLDWVPRDSRTPFVTFTDISYADGLFVAVGFGFHWSQPMCKTNIAISVDGVTWFPQCSGTVHDLYRITHGNGRFVAVGDSIVTSPDGMTWTKNPGTQAGLWGVTYGNDIFVAVGHGGIVLTSTNGINWDLRDSGERETLLSVAYHSGVFVAVGFAGIVITSLDGVRWTKRMSGNDSVLANVAYGNGSFLATGPGGVILQSGPVVHLAIEPGLVARLTLSGPVDRFYQIEHSPTAEINTWQPLGETHLVESPGSWLDLKSTTSAVRFYRAVLME